MSKSDDLDETGKSFRSEILLNILIDSCVGCNQVNRAIQLVQDILLRSQEKLT